MGEQRHEQIRYPPPHNSEVPRPYQFLISAAAPDCHLTNIPFPPEFASCRPKNPMFNACFALYLLPIARSRRLTVAPSSMHRLLDTR